LINSYFDRSAMINITATRIQVSCYRFGKGPEGIEDPASEWHPKTSTQCEHCTGAAVTTQIYSFIYALWGFL